jgi:hypothetical protein
MTLALSILVVGAIILAVVIDVKFVIGWLRQKFER